MILKYNSYVLHQLYHMIAVITLILTHVFYETLRIYLVLHIKQQEPIGLNRRGILKEQSIINDSCMIINDFTKKT